MYLLYLDQSGAHAGSPILVLAGIAVQEQDGWHLQQKLEGLLQRKLPPGLNHLDFELHATDIKSPIRKAHGRKTTSNWAQISLAQRLSVPTATFGALRDFSPHDEKRPTAMFGAVVDRRYKDREERAYEEVLHRFDEMLTRHAIDTGVHERGIVIHDRRVLERDIQGWASMWRHAAGRIGKLTHLVDVPFFADSRSSRLIQAADFVAWGLYRFYGEAQDDRWIKAVWKKFDAHGGVMHGLIHVSPEFAHCTCPPCTSRHP